MKTVELTEEDLEERLQAVAPHRTAALDDSRLIATRTLVSGFQS